MSSESTICCSESLQTPSSPSFGNFGSSAIVGTSNTPSKAYKYTCSEELCKCIHCYIYVLLLLKCDSKKIRPECKCTMKSEYFVGHFLGSAKQQFELSLENQFLQHTRIHKENSKCTRQQMILPMTLRDWKQYTKLL